LALEDLTKGVISDFPTAGAAVGNTLRVYARRQSSQLWEALWRTTEDVWLWASLSDLTASTETLLSGSPSVSVQGDVVKVYVRTSAGNLASYGISGRVWRFSNHGSFIIGSPTATPGGAFVRGMNGDLWLFDGTRWVSLGGDFD
jgi:hypothetical protein